MRHLSQVLLGVFAAILSSLLVFGSLAMSLAEGGIQVAFLPTLVPTPTQPLPTPRPGEPTYTPSPTASPTATPTSAAPTSQCAFPTGWVEINVGWGDTWESIAQQYQVAADDLRKGNCMPADWLEVGLVIRVPLTQPSATLTEMPSSTPTIPPPSFPNPTKFVVPVQCSRPIAWVIYVVRHGDTLSQLGRTFGIPWQELMRRNCLPSTTIRTGQRIYVPYLPTRTPYPYPTATFLPPVYTPTFLPRSTTAVPPTSTLIPLPTTAVPPTSTPVPLPTTVVPPTSTPIPLPTTAVPPTSTPIPLPTTAVPPTNTPIPLPITVIPPTSTPIPLPSTAVPPTNTPIPLPTLSFTLVPTNLTTMAFTLEPKIANPTDSGLIEFQ